MRWKALFLLLGLLAFLGIIGIFCLDGIVGWSIEHAFQTVTGAKVEVERLHINLIKLNVSIAKIQIANPNNTWQNLVETDNINFQMDWEPLFQGKIVIDDITVTDIMLFTKRKTDGRIRKFILPGPFGQAQRKLNKDIATLPVINPELIKNPINVDQVMSSYQLKTELSSDQLRQKIEATRLDWENNIKKLPEIKGKIDTFQTKFQQIQSAPLPQNINELRERVQSIQDLQKLAGEIQTNLSDTLKKLAADFNDLKAEIGSIRGVAAEDLQALLKLAKLPDVGPINISEALLGNQLLNESSFVINMVDNLQKSIPVSLNSPPKENHPRGGQDITFPGRITYPQLLIKKVTISAKGTPDSFFDGYYAKGTVSGITSQPQLYQKPLLVNVTGNTSNQVLLNFDANLNHLTPAIHDEFALKFSNIPSSEIELPKSNLLPDKISSGTVNISSKLLIEPESFQLDTVVETQNIKCLYIDNSSRTDLLSELIRDTLSGIDKVIIRYQLEGVAKKMKMTVSSNLNDLINRRFNALVGAKIDQARQEINARIQKILSEKQKELEASILSYQKQLESQVNQVQEKIDREKQNLEDSRQKLETSINNQIRAEQEKIEQAKKELIDKAKKEEDALREKAKQEEEAAKEKARKEEEAAKEKAKQELENKIKSQLPKLP